MEILEAVAKRHSVRSYTDKKIEGEVLEALQNEITLCNKESGLNIKLITNDKEVFTGKLAQKGGFKGVNNYLVLAGENSDDLHEKCGYYGEKIVLKAQMLGLNTCWVAGTYNRRKAKNKVDKGEKLVCVIAIGYGETQGKPHKNTLIDFLFRLRGDMPSWFMEGMQSAMLAPTAMNKQKFRFTMLDGNKVKAEATGRFCSGIDLGIVKLHFEIGAGNAEYEFV